MIVTKLSGGLGNQMFQYAAARALAIERNTNVGIDLSWFDATNNQDSTRFFELDCFKIKPKVVNIKDYALLTMGLGKIGRLKTRLNAPFKKVLIKIDESKYNYDPQIRLTPNDSYLVGHWTTEKYFCDHRQAILNDYTWVNPPNKMNVSLLSKIQSSTNPVGLHIRRGDYVSNKTTKDYHGVIDLSYYKKAEQMLRKKVSQPEFYIFSDDPLWVRQNLRLKSKMHFVSANKKGSDDMRLLKHCRHYVIANSTFSWWAAWLGQTTDTIVFAPKKWVSGASINTSDVIPDNWEKI